MIQSFVTRFGVLERTLVEPEDIRDAIATLTFSKKIVLPIRAPGLGPQVFLDWAQAELDETLAVSPQATELMQRKAFTSTILAKTAVECLLDWYLDSSHIGYTVRPHAGTEEKLEALDAKSLLAIGQSLFREILFEPRNQAIHQYQAIDRRSAQHAYELANLFLHNAQRAHAPGSSNVYYGNLEIARGDEARRIGSAPPPRKSRAAHKAERKYFYFGGIGSTGEHSVLFCRMHTPSIAVLQSDGSGGVNVRYAPLNKFTSAMLREILNKLETSKPSLHELEKSELDHVMQNLNSVLTAKISTSD